MNNNICLLGDLHFGIRKNSDVYFDSQKNFLINQLIPYLNFNKINDIFLLGDIFNDRGGINTKIQNDVFNLFNDYFKTYNLHILIGNHDTYFSDTTKVNSIKFLSKFNNIKIIEQPEILNYNDKKILLAPWITDFNQFITYISDKTFDISFGHYNIKNFHYNKVKTSEDGLDGNLFSGKCKKVFSGHFHIRSKQKFNDCEIVYIGSPYQLNRGDIDEERGFVILNTDDLSYEHINNTVSMKFVKLNYPNEFSETTIKNNIIDVHVKYDENYCEEKIDKYIQQITNFNPAFPPQIIIETNQILDNNIDLTKLNFSSVPDLIQEYIDSLELKNKSEIFNMLINLYNEVK